MKLHAGIADGCVDISSAAESRIATAASTRAPVDMGTSCIAMVLVGDIVFTFKSRPRQLAPRLKCADSVYSVPPDLWCYSTPSILKSSFFERTPVLV